LKFPTLERLGWNDELARQFDAEATGLEPGRVTVQHRGAWEVVSERSESLVEITGRLRHEADPGELPVVGDWVGLRDGLIDFVLPRRSKFSRKTPWTSVSEQVLVANVEVAFLVMGLDERDFNVRRLERYLTTAWEGGANPVIVLNKADLAPDLERQLMETKSVAFGVPVHPVSAETGDGVQELRRHLAGNRTVVLLGSSGVGKSSLINRLLGDEHFRIGDVRSDGRGRHTTTHRELVRLPGGALLIDTPGIRSLGVAGAADGIDTAFADIADLALTCRFSDCRHAGEPGCAIAAALSDGTLSADRLASHRKLEREAAYVARANDPLLQAEERRKWKAIHVAVNQQMRRKYGDDR
jgi:ribosome biogenesis GTPase / thiamine phosphate phosphatase